MLQELFTLFKTEWNALISYLKKNKRKKKIFSPVFFCFEMGKEFLKCLLHFEIKKTLHLQKKTSESTIEKKQGEETDSKSLKDLSFSLTESKP